MWFELFDYNENYFDSFLNKQQQSNDVKIVLLYANYTFIFACYQIPSLS